MKSCTYLILCFVIMSTISCEPAGQIEDTDGGSSSSSSASVLIEDIEASINCYSADSSGCTTGADGFTAEFLVAESDCDSLTEVTAVLASKEVIMDCTATSCEAVFSELDGNPLSRTSFAEGTRCLLAIFDLNNSGEADTGDAVCGGDYNFVAINAPYSLLSESCSDYSDTMFSLSFR